MPDYNNGRIYTVRCRTDNSLINVGSIKTNDLLRKMYESAIMICGEVYNHNPENLMYNFFNDKQ